MGEYGYGSENMIGLEGERGREEERKRGREEEGKR